MSTHCREALNRGVYPTLNALWVCSSILILFAEKGCHNKHLRTRGKILGNQTEGRMVGERALALWLLSHHCQARVEESSAKPCPLPFGMAR